MGESGSRVLLVTQQDQAWVDGCVRELRALGVATVEAHNCWSGDLVLGRDEVEVVVIDGDILCDWITPERPGPVLGRGPQLKVVVVNAQNLDGEHRSVALAHRAALVDGSDLTEIISAVQTALQTEDRPSSFAPPPAGAS